MMLLLVHPLFASHPWRTYQNYDRLKSYYEDVWQAIVSYPGKVVVTRIDFLSPLRGKVWPEEQCWGRCDAANYDLYEDFHDRLLSYKKNNFYLLKDGEVLEYWGEDAIQVGGGHLTGCLQYQLTILDEIRRKEGMRLQKFEILTNLSYFYTGKPVSCKRVSEVTSRRFCVTDGEFWAHCPASIRRQISLISLFSKP